MTRAIRLRRVFVATLILTALTTTFPVATACAVTAEATYTYTPKTICPVDWWEGWAVKKLIRCAANHYGVSVEKVGDSLLSTATVGPPSICWCSGMVFNLTHLEWSTGRSQNSIFNCYYSDTMSCVHHKR